MTILEAYIRERNPYRTLFGQKEFAKKGELTGADAADLYRSLDSDLSPEMLTMDGERPTTLVRNRAAFLRNAVRELDALGFHRPTNVYTLPEQVGSPKQ